MKFCCDYFSSCAAVSLSLENPNGDDIDDLAITELFEVNFVAMQTLKYLALTCILLCCIAVVFNNIVHIS